jgi:hypothetical protein
MPTDETSDQPAAEPTTGWVRAGKRYGPFAAIAGVIAGAILVAGGGGGDDDGGDDDEAITSGDGERSEEDLIRSGPMTPQRAELLGEQVDFGPGCDPETSRIKLPTVYAAPCVEPFEGDNGGATSPGVTGDAVKLVVYTADPALDPLGSAVVGGAGANLDPTVMNDTVQDYVDVFTQVYETYGREIEVEFYTGTGRADDQDAARADAIAIADMEPFAVINGPLQANATFADVLASERVINMPSQPLPEGFVNERLPYIWEGTTPNQAARLSAEAFANLAGPGKAEMAGDPEIQARDRVYAVVHYDTLDGMFEEAFVTLRDELAEHGIELATDVRFELDLARIQETMRTIVTQLEEAGVTTVIFTGDPLTPDTLTTEATAQSYYPEWLLGSSLLADTALFARTYDQAQWGNGFGVAVATTAGATDIATQRMTYEWAFGQEPPSNIYGVIEPPLRYLFTGIHLAGSELTPEGFRDGLFRYPPSGGGPTRSGISWGDHGIFPDTDYGAGDDVALIWWDPDAEGVDEVGQEGRGMYRFADGGRRYALGELPESIDESGLFDAGTSAIELEELPEEDQAPDYPPPSLP